MGCMIITSTVLTHMNLDAPRTTGQGEGLEPGYLYTSLILSSHSFSFSLRAATEIGILSPSCTVDLKCHSPKASNKT